MGASATGRGGRARLVELGDWVGMPGAEAAEGARSMGFRPAMELVDAAGEPGVVVEQEPEAGTRVARNCFVTLLISSNANGGAGVERRSDLEDELDDDFEECDQESLFATVEEDEADERHEEELEADEDWDRPRRADGGSFDGRAVRSDRVGDEEAMTKELPLRPAARRLVRVNWLLVIGGWRVLLREVSLATALALAAAWAAGGIAGLMGALAVVAVLSGLAAAACVAAGGNGGGGGDGRAFGERRMVVDLEQRRRWPDGRFDAM